MQPFSGNQRPDLLNMSDEHIFCTALVTRHASFQILFAVSHVCHRFLEMLQNPHVLLIFGKVQNPLSLPRKTTSVPSKVVRACGVFNSLTWKCASRPQRRALFRHVNSQKCSENGVLSTFWLGNVLRAITACNRTRRFSEPTFQPSGATNHWKNTVFCDYRTFLRTWIFFLLSSFFFSSLLFSSLLWLFPPLLFHLSMLSEVWLLNFLRQWIYMGTLCDEQLNTP